MFFSLRQSFSGLTHLFAALLALIGLGALIQASPVNPIHLIAVTLYGSSLVVMYFASSAYHLLRLPPNKQALLRCIDHITIFFLIAGSYSPFCLVTLKGTLGYSMFALIWAIALLGFLLKIIWMDAPRWLSVMLYVLMGWISLVFIYPLSQNLSPGGLLWLFGGGVLYTLGAVVYGRKKPDPIPNIFGFHEIWHLFVMAASFCHFWAIYRFV